MLKKFACVCMIIGIMLNLCGCDFFTADIAELLSPPLLSEDLYPISQALEASVDTKYDLQYPAKGNYRSAVIKQDINGDSLEEAFAFYSTTDGEVITMNINMLCLRNGKWISAAQQKIVAGGVNQVEFCDLDSDGALEILVGWEVYGTAEMQLAVYSFGENTLTQRFLQKYNNFVTCDLDENGQNEVFIVNLNTADELNSAAAYVLTEEGVTQLYYCELDPTVKAINEPVVAELSTGRPAVYIDEIKGVGAVTEVLFVERNLLVNPLYDAMASETTATLRSANFTVRDINNDGVLEIPIQQNVPSVSKTNLNEKLYLTNWCSFNGEVLTNQQTTMINVNDGFCYTIPPKWNGKIAVLKDTDKRIRELYVYNEDMTVGESLVYFGAVKSTKWDSSKYAKEDFQKITATQDTVFYCRISKAAKAEGITLEEIKKNFELFE